MIRFSALFRLPSKVKRRARRNRMATLFYLLLLCVLLLAPFYAIYRPRLLIRYFQHRWPDVLWEVSVPADAGKVIALTIDDAPSEYTREIVQLLKDNDARATLFVIGGQVEGREEVLREVVAAGNELGNHAMHDEAARALDLDTLEDQIGRVQGLIRQAYADAGAGRGAGAPIPHPRLNAWHILSMARSGGIIVCHDRRSWTIPMLRQVLPELRRRGYRVVTVSELLEAASP
ncbi:hypothetical protein INS49_008645 [Diaporthe citri]|uniref:uncharacterized protein n=1 Tax=Diaporthe citri TaxID=83186 RepID=UPI001C7E983A|nr:uncharacterized protein INS49_008645 [Diaporthe citri]KAG6363544.1 hypothetical protein INS49_008645 [Diaporthe citri]